MKAESAGDINSYITLANLCAGAFQDDIEAQSVEMVVASVTDPDASDVSLDVFHTAISEIQTSLSTTSGTGAWQHTLSNPYDAVEFAGFRSGDAKTHAESLLTDATVTIDVSAPLSVTITHEAMEKGLDGGCQVPIDDIEFCVTLEKGSWRIIQNYRLSGAVMEGRLVGAKALLFVNGELAECKLEYQTVMRIANAN